MSSREGSGDREGKLDGIDPSLIPPPIPQEEEEEYDLEIDQATLDQMLSDSKRHRRKVASILGRDYSREVKLLNDLATCPHSVVAVFRHTIQECHVLRRKLYFARKQMELQVPSHTDEVAMANYNATMDEVKRWVFVVEDVPRKGPAVLCLKQQDYKLEAFDLKDLVQE